jgi:hypothetical protein
MASIRNVIYEFRTNTDDEFTRKNEVYRDGEPVVVKSPGGPARLKMGDGHTSYVDLPFLLAIEGDIPDIGNLDALTTDVKTSIVDAINELNMAGVSLALLYDNAKAG